MCSLVALVALANHVFYAHFAHLSLALVLVLHFLSCCCLCKVCSLVSDALLVALDTLMRFVAWSDKHNIILLFSYFGTHVGNIYTVSALVVH